VAAGEGLGPPDAIRDFRRRHAIQRSWMLGTQRNEMICVVSVTGRVVLIGIIAAALVFGALAAVVGYSLAGPGTTKRPSATRVTIFATPIGSAPKGGTRLDGTCNLGGSDVSNRTDAARCFTTLSDARGVNVFDPCFHSEGGSTPGTLDLFVCPNDPWRSSPASTVVAVHGGTGTSGETPSSFQPWALLLSNGQRCLAISGASGTTAGLRYNYGCSAPPFDRTATKPNGHAGGIVLGYPDQHAPTWIVLFAKDTQGTGFSPIAVRQAFE
jgi:hypothetical protein